MGDLELNRAVDLWRQHAKAEHAIRQLQLRSKSSSDARLVALETRRARLATSLNELIAHVRLRRVT
jgi:hypothetical protein